jgi:hypothetical protein
MKRVFTSGDDVSCRGPEVAADFVTLVSEAMRPNQKNAVSTMLKKTVEKDDAKVRQL